MSVLKDIQLWYQSQCDGEWEHESGISIETLDNPGWSLKIDLKETHLEKVAFNTIKYENSENDWYICKVESAQFLGFGDPTKLEVILQTFIDWAKADEGWFQPPVYETTDDKDRQFWELLLQIPVVDDEPCGLDKCEQDRIRNSVFCREHHFERYKQK